MVFCPLGMSSSPGEFDSVGATASAWMRPVVANATPRYRLNLLCEITAGKRVIDETYAAALESVPAVGVVVRLPKGDELQIGAVLERNQCIVSATRVFPARNDGEPDSPPIIGCLLQSATMMTM